jgi:hypothetical protein
VVGHGCRVRRAVTLLGAMIVMAGCSAEPGGDPAPSPEPSAAPPPAPPAACLLDPGALTTVTGLTWIPDQSTASDTRCVYDLRSPASTGESAFLTVEIGPAATDDPQAELDTVAAACADGSRASLSAAATGFVCRFRGGSVFAAAARSGQLVTVSASAVPEGTTAARLVLALQQQLDGA